MRPANQASHTPTTGLRPLMCCGFGEGTSATDLPVTPGSNARHLVSILPWTPAPANPPLSSPCLRPPRPAALVQRNLGAASYFSLAAITGTRLQWVRPRREGRRKGVGGTVS